MVDEICNVLQNNFKSSQKLFNCQTSLMGTYNTCIAFLVEICYLRTLCYMYIVNTVKTNPNILPFILSPCLVSNSWMDNNMVNALTPHLIGKRPNTYTFTKSLAEHVLLHEADNFPIAIFRPSIIGAAYKEPFEVSSL